MEAWNKKYISPLYCVGLVCIGCSEYDTVILEVNEKCHKLERGYRDCIKRTRHKTRTYSIPHIHKKGEKRQKELHDPCVYIVKNTKELHTDLYGLCNVYCVDK